MKRSTAGIAIIVAAAGLVRIPAMTQSFWPDEAYTALMAKMPIVQMIATTLGDVHPPTYYFLPTLSMAIFGNAEWAARVPSFVLGLVAIWLTWRVTARLFDQRIGLVAAALMAANPFMIYYSTEARMYTLLTCAALLALLGAVERHWWMLGAGTGLMLMTHNLAVLYLPGLALAVLLIGLPSISLAELKRPVLAALAGAIPWMAWIPNAIRQATSGQFAGQYWISEATANLIAKLLAEYNMMWSPHFRFAYLARIGALISFALIVFPLVDAVRRKSKPALIMAAFAFLPGVAALCISVTWQPVMLSRTLIAGLPAWCMLTAWWVCLPRKWNAASITLMGLAVFISCGMGFVALLKYDRSGGELRMVDELAAIARPGDVLCSPEDERDAMFLWYYPGEYKEDSGVGGCQFYLIMKEEPGLNMIDRIETPVRDLILYATEHTRDGR